MTDECLAAIGAVTVEFAVLESQLHFGIWLLLVGNRIENQPLGQTVTANLSFRKSLDLFCALVRHKFPAYDAEVKILSGRVSEAESKRNIIVHSTWVHAQGEQVLRIKTTARGKLNFQSEHMTLADLQTISQEIHATAEDVQNFYLARLYSDQPRVTL